MVTTRSKAKSKQEKTAFWRYHLENHRRSSVSQVQYCRDYSLALSTFQYWKKKLKIDGLQEKARFYPLTVQTAQPKQHSSAPSGLALHVSNDEVRVEVAREFSALTLKKLLVVLKQL